eukprot:CAMPEP_0117648160 /NCGR_PEP_ID=MMETSP0804-20121206/241_1 /TAXON_ID=1074897 /ORGANISM="Tetraselmis astigmatica, Strain CCMP880" /LENGTH=96 /DNA_ID=CAMNT_0005453713 /DNA_START=1070 /DNA_END=1360 /DNA_ORIENTATION=-
MIDAESLRKMLHAEVLSNAVANVKNVSGDASICAAAASDANLNRLGMFTFKDVVQLKYPDASADDVRRMIVTARILHMKANDEEVPQVRRMKSSFS